MRKEMMWLLLGTFLLGYSFNILIENVGVKEAMAITGSKCDYTYINDPREPDIGQNGNIEYGEDWGKVLNGGWRLHLVGGKGYSYIFEKCN